MRKNPARLKVVFPVGVSQCMQYVLQADILHPHNPKALPSSAAGRLAGTPWTGPTGPLSLAFRAGWPPPRQMTQVPACGSNYCIVTDVIYPLNHWLSFVSLLLSCLTVKSHPFPSPLMLPALSALSPFPPPHLLPGLPNFLFFDMLSNFLLSNSVIPFTIHPFTLKVDSPVIFGLSKGQCHEKFVKLRPWGDKLDPSTVFTFFWSAVKSLQFFNCMLSRSKTCLMTFSNCCVSQTNSVFCCCSQLHTNVRTQQCSPPPSPAPALPQCVSYCCGQHTDFNMSQLIPEVAGNCCTLHSVKVWSATTGQLVCML